eukprot:TRINITY_DN111933_c0_g1_i1.p1 TRINITY_DN111933_c0_g1~~TRINITY_DN111933_c0_g1_i1.p1  ORF type:complete len:435 (+),score=88.63 TRINITY_DN111933_c0_g1_i1:43-1305(+)
MAANSDSAQAVKTLSLPPCEVLREVPGNWDIVALIKASKDDSCDKVFPKPSRFLHSSLKVEQRLGRGRCLVAEKKCEAGDLLLVDAPIATAASQVALQDLVCSRAAENADFRRLLFSFCGDEADDEEERGKAAEADGEVNAALVSRILNRNCTDLGSLPVEMSTNPQALNKAAGRCGLWPLASIVNHSLRPNAVRSYVGEAVCLRLIRDLEPGNEVLENYLSPLLPRAKRVEILRAGPHGLKDEGPDELDAPPALLADARSLHDEASVLMFEGELEDAFKRLTEGTNLCSECEQQDPAFTDVFTAFSKVAGVLGGGAPMQLEGMAMALELATGREAFSVTSCGLSAELLSFAWTQKKQGEEIEDEQITALEELAREHVAKVYGPESGLFEAINPGLAPDGKAPGSETEERSSKRQKVDEK